MRKILTAVIAAMLTMTATAETGVTVRVNALNSDGVRIVAYVENCTVTNNGDGEYIVTAWGVGSGGLTMHGTTNETFTFADVVAWNRQLQASFQLETSTRFTNTISSSDTWTLIETSTWDPVYTNRFRYETNTMFYTGSASNINFLGTFTGRMAPQTGSDKKLQIGIRKNGIIVKSSTIYKASSGVPEHFTVLYYVSLSAGDRLQFFCRNNTGVQDIVFRTIENQLSN